ncbi:MAG: hypothetical protein EAZ47_03490 [Bacteroidetes bacterium]|nr:MAG: hypothetical protein EAY72_13965 [Bacteroidota bacterium]TAF95116.1 MAG: hypothetical protein EAZ47_03490 [Bacteroidota bacterium]
MNYFRIHFTTITQLRGNDSYIKTSNPLIPNIDKCYFEVKNFIGNIEGQKIVTPPYLIDMELYKTAKMHDLIMSPGPISRKLVVSTKLKTILEAYNKDDIQYFNMIVKKGNDTYHNYWILHPHTYKQEIIDYQNLNVTYEKHKPDFSISYESEIINLALSSIDDFNLHMANKKPEEISYIEPLQIKKDCKEHFFCLKNVFGGLGYYVSEKLKKIIETDGCSGIEFQPIEFTFIQWLQTKRKEIT